MPADSAAAFEPSAELEATVTGLDQQLDRWTALQDIVRSLPLTAPLDQYRISSRYGERRPSTSSTAPWIRLVDMVELRSPFGRPKCASSSTLAPLSASSRR